MPGVRIGEEYILGRLESFETMLRTMKDGLDEDKQIASRSLAVRDQAMINSIFKAVKDAMAEERENNRNLFASFESKLASCTTIQDSAIDMIKSDLEGFRIDLSSHGTMIKRHSDAIEDHGKELAAVKKEVKKMIDDPGNKAKTVLQAVGAGAIPVAGYGIFALVKSMIGGGK
jgi:hypothetical protein